jgi:hypothetical protein
LALRLCRVALAVSGRVIGNGRLDSTLLLNVLTWRNLKLR